MIKRLLAWAWMSQVRYPNFRPIWWVLWNGGWAIHRHVSVASEAVATWIAWHLPRKIVYWCAIRLVAEATTGKHSGTEVDRLTAIDALDRWVKR